MIGIVGLGNPGEKYEKNRHNAGFIFLDTIAKDLSWSMDKYTDSLIVKEQSFILAKPQTFMNSSGEAVRKFVDFYAIDPMQLYVVHDDLDIKLGEYKIQRGVGPKLHNGVNSIEEHVHNNQFWRIRIGVDNRTSEKRIPGDIYSLQDFTKQELEMVEKVNKAIIKELEI